MRIPQHFIDELIARSDIVEVISRRVPLKKAGREFSACCPFHDEKTPSFTVSPQKQFYHCFGCGAHGTALGFLMEHEHMSFIEAVEDLAAMAGMEVPREAGASGPDLELYEVMERAARFFQRCLKEHPAAADYVRERGLDAETLAAFGIGYAPDAWDRLLQSLGTGRSAIRRLLQVGMIVEKQNDTGQDRHYDRFRNRLMFPIRDARGRVIAFGGRVLGPAREHEPKYLNSPETPLFRKGRELYGLHEMRRALRDIRRVLVVEGYMDVVALAQHAVPYAVATLGTATTADHLERLFRICDEIVFCFDGDRAGRVAAWRALRNALPCIQGSRQIAFLFLPEGHDPDSLVRSEGTEAFEARIPGAVPLSEFMLGQLSAQVDLETLDGRARLAELARPLLETVPAGVYRELLIERLAETVQLPRERLAPIMASRDQRPASAQAHKRAVKRPRIGSGRDTLIRRAIRLVVHYPAIAQAVDDPARVAGIELPGVPLLVELLEDCRANPHISTAGLVERWRDHDTGRHLARLAAEDVLVEAEEAGIELGALIRQLVEREAPARRTDELLRKEAEQGLTDAEKQELKRLLTRQISGEGDAKLSGNDGHPTLH